MTDEQYVRWLIRCRIDDDTVIAESLKRNGNNVYLAASDLLYMVALMTPGDYVGAFLRIADTYREIGNGA